MARDLVSTGEAASALGIHRTTLLRWWRDEVVTPVYITPGGHARWHIDLLKDELRSQLRREE